MSIKIPIISPSTTGLGDFSFQFRPRGFSFFGFGGKKVSKEKIPSLFEVEVRRYGKFKPIATTKTLRSAFAIGKSRVGRTLAATFRIKAPAFKKTFIEPRRLRLSTLTEVGEIQRAKRKKKKKKRRKK